MTRVKEHKTFYFSMLIMSFFISILSGCSGGTGGGNWNDPGAGADTTRPTVILTVPVTGATVPTNAKITAKFSEAMAPATITAASFTVRPSGPPLGVEVAGTVTYKVATMTATFTPPVANFAPNTPYTATITVQATDLAGNAMAVNKVWTFTTAAGSDSAAPLVTSTLPADLATGVSVTTKTITATFDEPMDPALFDGTSFTLQTTGPPLGAVIAGAYSYDALTNTVTFAPTADLVADTLYTATVTSTVTDLAGISLVVPAVGVPNNPWTFRTAVAHLGPAPVVLGATLPYGVLSNTGVTLGGGPLSVTGFRVDGDVGISPAGACVGCDNTTVTGVIENGTVTAATAMTALTNAYNDAIGRSTNLCTLVGGGDLTINPPPVCAGASNGIFAPGLYWSGSSMAIPAGGTITLDAKNDPTAVFIFQSESTINSIGGNTKVILANQAQSKNVFWVAKSSSTIGGTTSDFKGTVIALVAVTVNTGTAMEGRALARGAAVTVQDGALITVPAP